MWVRFAQQRGTLDPTQARTSIGEITVGPRGLLDLLETDLGLPPVLTHSAERIIAYRGVLQALDNADRFYHRSFAVDPVNVARTLLSWRDLAEQIGYELDPGIKLMPQAKTGSDLHLLQTTLLGGVEGQTAALQGDGSLLILRSATRDISAQAIGELIRSEQVAAGHYQQNSVVLAEIDGIIVDNALERCGLPRCRFQHYSQFRAVAQVLKLVLGLVWQPGNPHLLMQFLIHPLSPLKSFVRQRLSEAVASQPGVGGRAWRSALVQIAEIEARQGAGEKEIAQTSSEVAYWCASPRYSRTGAPIAPLAERTRRINNWLNRVSTNWPKPILTG